MARMKTSTIGDLIVIQEKQEEIERLQRRIHELEAIIAAQYEDRVRPGMHADIAQAIKRDREWQLMQPTLEERQRAWDEMAASLEADFRDGFNVGYGPLPPRPE